MTQVLLATIDYTLRVLAVIVIVALGILLSPLLLLNRLFDE